MNYPTPAMVRDEARPNQAVPIRWSVVDPWLKRLKRGEIRRFALATGLSLTTIVRRRRALGVRLNGRMPND